MIQQKLRRFFILIYIITLLTLKYHSSHAWGFFAHKLINRQAVFSLPEPLFNFYRYHIYSITTNSVNPDKRRAIIEDESPKHYIDLDHYSAEEVSSMPHNWNDAKNKIPEEKLKEHGIIPWNILNMKNRLTDAFKRYDVEQIIALSADIGHYIADANVPLHTTKNYNGQLTNQHGIHSLWESRLPELFASEYDLFIGEAEYVYNLHVRVWTAIHNSHACVETILEKERELSQKFGATQKYTFEQRGKTLQKVYSKEYSREYHNMLNGMVEKQLKASIRMIADIWYTCWVDAGMPNIDILMNQSSPCNPIIDKKAFKNRMHEKLQKIKNFRNCD
jgi:hypothetical protein